MTNIVNLFAVSFNSRITLGDCLININGSSYDCEVVIGNPKSANPRYSVLVDGKEVTHFFPYHLYGTSSPVLFQIKGAGARGGDATLIVPTHGLLDDEDDEDEDE